MRRSWRNRRATRVAAVALGSGLLLLAVSAGPGAASAVSGRTWMIQPSPNEPHAAASQLAAASCVKNGPCAAVGTYATGKGTPEHEFALAMRRSGTTWVLTPTPFIKGVGDSLLNGVSCASASSCVTVGYTVTSPRQNPAVRALAERWNGTAWMLDSPPAPAGRHPWAVLDDVSCPSRAFCLAVGGYIKNTGNPSAQEQPLAEEWNGTSWTPLTAPNPHAENGSELTSVDCVSASACEVDGDYDYADVAQSVFAYDFNGSSWAAQKQVNPGGQESNGDNSISCASASACTSAGFWTSNSPLALAERWNGAAWIRQPLPRPHGSVTDELSSVSCAAAAACTAVGNWAANYNENPTSTLAMTWNGKSWRLAATPTPAGGGGLAGVSCTVLTDCVAVGSAGASTLVEVSPGS